MKYVRVFIKDYLTKEIIDEGEAVLLNEIDHTELESFWELKFINDMRTTQCRWIRNSKIYVK